jgi:signal transduction histidine kinase/CheY-like chemotaxis protein
VLGVASTPALPNDTLYQVLEDSRGRIYAFTNKGVARLTPQGDGGDPGLYAVDTFTTEDGLPGNEFNGGAGAVDERGRLWAGSVSGVAAFDPSAEVELPPLPALALTSALRLDDGARFGAGAALAHDESSVAFGWTLPTLFRGDERRYRTELVGLDRGPGPWSVDEKREYTTLREGTYELRVWGRDHRGRESGPVALPFSVRAAPWRTALAWTSYWAALAAVVYAAYRLRLRALTRRNEVLEATVLARTSELADKVQALAEEERRARAAEEEARAASRAKSVFLSTMSHELRTPLNAILGFAQLLGRDRGASREQQGRVDVIQKSGEHLLGLINDVLSMAKIEAGKITVDEVPFALAGTLGATHAMMRGRADEKAVALACEIDGALPAAVSGDEGKLRQILVNLVGNAIKFTEQGRVVVRARWADGVATIDVTDTGKGISRDELARLFDAFSQSESGRRAREGTGLGLAISRAFARKMGGDVSAESEPGRGSTFRVVIPLPAVVAEVADARPPVRGLAEGQGEIRVLVVDDADGGRAVLRALLESIGFAVVEAANGRDAIRVHEEQRPHATFLDMHLGDVDGDEVARAIRAREATWGVRSAVLALSASAFDEERDALLSAGCDAFLTKPFRADDVLDALARHARVRYVRDDDAPPSSREDDATPGRLAALPDDVRAALLRAVVAGDVGASRGATELVAARDPGLGAALRAMVDAFQLEEIEARLRATSGPSA